MTWLKSEGETKVSDMVTKGLVVSSGGLVVIGWGRRARLNRFRPCRLDSDAVLSPLAGGTGPKP